MQMINVQGEELAKWKDSYGIITQRHEEAMKELNESQSQVIKAQGIINDLHQELEELKKTYKQLLNTQGSGSQLIDELQAQNDKL